METFGTKIDATPGSPPPGMYVPIEFPSLTLLDTRATDGRQILSAGFGTLDLPRTIKMQTRQAGGHDGAMPVGRLDFVQVDGKNASASGWLIDNPDGRAAAHYVKTQVLRGNSVDLSVASKDISIRFIEEDGSFWMEVDMANAKVGATTLCMQPAFDNAGAIIPDGWEVDGVDAAEEEAVVAALSAEETPHAFAFSVIDSAPAFDPELFAAPKAKAAYAIEVDADDRYVHGYVAAWGTPHTANPKVLPPKSRTNYAYFANGHVKAGDDLVATGRLVLGGNHADIKATLGQALDHYANTTVAWADVAIGEDEFGIWVAGVVRPGATAEQIHTGRASVLSGDWRFIGGGLEMCAALSVNAGGFPLPRRLQAVSFAHGDGHLLSLTGAGVVPRAATPGGIDPSFQAKVAYLAERAIEEDRRALLAQLDAELGSTEG